MYSISNHNSIIQSFLHINLDSENRFLSVKKINGVWDIKTEKVSECKNLAKKIISQTQLFETLIGKLRGQPIILLSKKNQQGWKINQKANAVFAELIKKAKIDNLDKTRKECAEVLETHLINYIRSTPATPKKLLTRSRGASISKNTRDIISGAPPKVRKSPSLIEKSSLKQCSSPAGSIHQKQLVKIGSQESEIHCMTEKEIKSCFIAWQARMNKKNEKLITYRLIKERMQSDPLPESAYKRIKFLGIYRNPSLANLAMQHILQLELKSYYSPHLMSQDYSRQLSRLEIIDSTGSKLWTYNKFDSEDKGEEAEFFYQANEFRNFLIIVLKLSSASGEFHEIQLKNWDETVSQIKKSDENKSELFSSMLENFWKLVLTYSEVSSEVVSFDQVEMSPMNREFISLLSCSRQNLYVTPFVNFIFLFPDAKFKMTKTPYTIKYNFQQEGIISVETSKALVSECDHYNFIDLLNIKITATSHFSLLPMWNITISLDLIPKHQDNEQRLNNFIQLMASRGLVVKVQEPEVIPK